MTYARLADVPDPIDMVDIFRASNAVPPIVDEALALKPLPKVIWMQLTVRNDEAAAKAEAAGVKVVMNRCPKIEYGRLSGEIGWTGVNSARAVFEEADHAAGFPELRRPAEVEEKTFRRCLSLRFAELAACRKAEFSSLQSAPSLPRMRDGFHDSQGGNDVPAHTGLQHARQSMPAPSPIPATGARATPIYQTTAYVFDDVDHAASLFGLKAFGNIYTRIMNPTQAVLEERVAALEGGTAGAGDGVRPCARSCWCSTHIMRPGDNFVAARKLYGGSINQFGHAFKNFGWEVRWADTTTISTFEKPDRRQDARHLRRKPGQSGRRVRRHRDDRRHCPQAWPAADRRQHAGHAPIWCGRSSMAPTSSSIR